MRPYFAKAGLHIEDEKKFMLVVDAQRTRVRTLVEMVEKSTPFYGPFLGHEEGAAKKHLRGAVKTSIKETWHTKNQKYRREMLSH